MPNAEVRDLKGQFQGMDHEDPVKGKIGKRKTAATDNTFRLTMGKRHIRKRSEMSSHGQGCLILQVGKKRSGMTETQDIQPPEIRPAVRQTPTEKAHHPRARRCVIEYVSRTNFIQHDAYSIITRPDAALPESRHADYRSAHSGSFR